MFAAAKRRHVVAVGKRFAEADKVGFDAVIVVGALQIQTEAGAHVVENKDHALFVAEFADRLPVFFGGDFVVFEVAVVIRLGDQAGNVAVAGIVSVFERLEVKPRHNHVVGNVFRQNTGVVDFLCPLEVAVIIALQEKHFLFMGVGARRHNRKGRCVGAVLCKERPVRGSDGVHQVFGTFDHDLGRRGRAVAEL